MTPLKFISTLICSVLGMFNFAFTQQHSSDSNQPYHIRLMEGHAQPGSTSSASFADERSDSIDILHYGITLDMTNTGAQTIEGNCVIQMVSKVQGVNKVRLDLLTLQVDSVVAQAPLTFSYNDTVLSVDLATALNINDTLELKVYYHGHPYQDDQWGGFYWQNGYVFHLGVGFLSDPHNLGKVWFPCFDSFTERAAFDFFITTAQDRVATCNGRLVEEQNLGGDTLLRHWRLEEHIPPYLACVTVNKYKDVHQIHNGLNGPIPIRLSALGSDTTNLKNSFANLSNAIQTFEEKFGPYRWQEVGYTITTVGAMEHATNVSYPNFLVNGTVQNEDIMAHELAHSWWGNLVTCETAEDMWINEGLASFLEWVFLEDLYGRDRYMEELKADHLATLRYTHHLEGGFQAISGIPHAYTYGDHTYVKGSIVAHTLRSYMGDQLFFDSMKQLLSNNMFQSMNAVQMRDQLSTISGLDLTPFFDGWVMNGGWPHFSIDSTTILPGTGGSDVEVHVRQRLRGAPALFSNVPLEVTFMDENWNSVTEQFTMSGDLNSFGFQLPFEPVYVTLNLDNKISHAVSDDQLVIRNTGSYDLDHALMNIEVTSISDSAYLRVEHHWAAADKVKNPNDLRMRVSTTRYWKIDGIFPDDFEATAEFVYDGKTPNNGSSGYLDHGLIDQSEDSLHLLHRAGPHEDWVEYPWYTTNVAGIDTDKFGIINMSKVLPGEYVLAVDQYNVGVENLSLPVNPVRVYPNPTNKVVNFDLSGVSDPVLEITIQDVTGREVMRVSRINGLVSNLDVSKLTDGVYIYAVKTRHQTFNDQLVIRH